MSLFILQCCISTTQNSLFMLVSLLFRLVRSNSDCPQFSEFSHEITCLLLCWFLSLFLGYRWKRWLHGVKSDQSDLCVTVCDVVFLCRQYSCHRYCCCDQDFPLGDVSADHEPGRQWPPGGRGSDAFCCFVHHKPWMGGLHCTSPLSSTAKCFTVM